jgi:glycine cleavage system H protein
MSQTPADLQYTKEHEWVAATATPMRMRMGITDFAQSALGDIVYVQLPEVGDVVTAGKVCGEVESTKSVSEIFAPLTGTVTAVNTALTSTPEMLNTDPYIQGWIAEIEVSTPPTDLLTAAQYVELTA